MALLGMIQKACNEMGITAPTAVVSGTDPTTKQLLALANRAGEELAKHGKFGWTALQREHTFTTTDATSEYAFPSDFEYLIDGTVWDRTNYERVRGGLSPQEWQAIKSGLIGSGVADRRYRIKRAASGSNARRFVLDPTPDSGSDNETLVYEYVANSWCQSSGGTAQSAWAADTDTGILSETLMRLGLKWRFLEAKGLSYQMALAEYEQERDTDFARDRPAPVLNMALRRRLAQLLGYNQIPETGYGPA